MLAQLADWLGSHLLEIAARLLRYAERGYGPQVSASRASLEDDLPAGLPPRIQTLVEELEQDPESRTLS